MYFPFDRAERTALVSELRLIAPRLDELDHLVATGRASAPEATEYEELIQRVGEYRTRYRNHVPLLPLSRCPYSGVVLYHSLDAFGLDGPWWDRAAPERPLQPLPETFAGLSGALTRADTPDEDLTFEIDPGPDAPFVIPRLLLDTSIVAVVTRLAIGPHIGWPIAYFSAGRGPADLRCPAWGADRWQRLDFDVVLSWDAPWIDPAERDFALEPWIESGRLMWIAPDDRAFALRSDVAGFLQFALHAAALTRET